MSIITCSRVGRLGAPYLFKSTIRSGEKVWGKSFTLYWKPHAEEVRIRFGVVVGRRVSPKAVVRNRIKRILRESLRENAAAFPKPQRGYVVIVVHRVPHPCSRAGVDTELQTCLKKLCV